VPFVVKRRRRLRGSDQHVAHHHRPRGSSRRARRHSLHGRTSRTAAVRQVRLASLV